MIDELLSHCDRRLRKLFDIVFSRFDIIPIESNIAWWILAPVCVCVVWGWGGGRGGVREAHSSVTVNSNLGSS
jgi:hypothetical protein